MPCWANVRSPILKGMKVCTKCGIEQPVSEYYKAAGTRDGLRGDCKSCFKARAKARYPQVREQAIARAKKWREENIDRFRENQRRMRETPEFKQRARAYHLAKTWGITPEQYDEQLAAQGGVCAICRQPPRPDISLHVDHDHESGGRRGLLCFRCNNALGDFGDDYDRLRGAAAYLIDHDAEMQEMARIAKERVRALR
jgi:hypothetical protein